MKFSVLFILITLTFNTLGQKAEIMKKLKAYHFKESSLTENLKDEDAKFAFNTKTTTKLGKDVKVKLAKFDPLKDLGERWTLISVNDREATSRELNQFNNGNNTEKNGLNGKILEDSWKIDSENENYLVVSFKYDIETLPKKYSFLGDCIGKAYFNKKTKRLEKAKFVNEKPIRYTIFNVTELNMLVIYKYNAEHNSYFIDKEDSKMTVSLFGKSVEVTETCDFYNYKKVK